MASCDDEFTLITDDTSTHQPNPNFHHHHHHHFSAPPPSRPPPEAILQSNGDGYTDDAFNSQPLVVVTYENESDPNRSAVSGARNDKRSDREELSDGGTPYSYNKKVKIASNSSDYRKDREEWSDAAIACLLDAYLEKFVQLNRGNLRVRDWEEVATAVSERCENQSKSVEQCKNKVDNLKKRYKLERNRSMNNNGGSGTSHWPWFKKMEDIVGNSLPVKSAVDDDKCVGGLNASGRQSKRYMTATSSGSGQITNMEAKSVTSPRWRRVVFKISGAALAGTGSQSTDPKVAMLIAREVSLACQMGIEVAIVVGGRNFFCGDSWVAATDSDRSTAYQIGMMATMMNSILLQSTLEKLGVQARVQSAFCLPDVSEPYNRQRAIRHLEKGRVIIFGGVSAGTGNPLFSTDTAAALRASELHADVVIKGTNVHGMYECDNISSVAYEHISFRELASRGSSQIDKMAATFCEENSIPVVIFSLHEPGNISRALSGENIGTLIDQTGRIG
ncbi:putative UMP kinase transcription factor Trihelix family [Helianthus annuus]|uniref:UMP kinase n=1 Tax=Helianthus annuus TaxID=4232 RepID=A0A251SQY5_HELAN|nr:uncharacterized protein LOC110898336 [Helianthus annuus]KAJ0480932.1 putative UMP kinase transcription factor Trihelix family [Helianthus annuus]KAJ0497470.1 putative UMP kinase transcription factor Trihelix family [Helianthus annuus]KAJ0670984.1 putative UMP kinase transcription factor Trihelix family [Helianthus annuus]KAJ0848941.1 putative UMP kinase transcription factor Trihelix family [Helianthus annuus]